MKPKKSAAVCCILTEKNEVLLLNRVDGKIPGWCLPGGKVEKEEIGSEAASREIKEETGLDIPEENLTYVGHASSADDEYIVAIFYTRVKEKFVPTLSKEHSGYEWVDINDMLKTVPNLVGKHCLIDNFLLAGNTKFFLMIVSKTLKFWSKKIKLEPTEPTYTRSEMIETIDHLFSTWADKYLDFLIDSVESETPLNQQTYCFTQYLIDRKII